MPSSAELFRRIHTRLLFALVALVVTGVLLSGNAQAQQEGSDTQGHLLFSRHCATCHGDTAKGDGVMASVMRIVPADLTQLAKNAGGEFPSREVYKSIDGQEKVAGHGSREMPVWGKALRLTGDLTEDEIKAQILSIVDYLQSIQE